MAFSFLNRFALFALCLAIAFPRADPVNYQVDDANGADDDACRAAQNPTPCKTLQYLFATVTDNAIVTVNPATYTITGDTITFADKADMTLKGSADNVVIEAEDAIGTIFTVTQYHNLTFEKVSFSLDKQVALNIDGTSGINLNSIVLNWKQQDQTEWNGIVIITNSDTISITAPHVHKASPGPEITLLPFVFEIDDSTGVTITQVNDESTSVGLISAKNCEDLQITESTIKATVSNKIFIRDCPPVTFDQLHVSAPANTVATSGSMDLDAKQLELVKHISVMSEIDSELLRRARLHNEYVMRSNLEGTAGIDPADVTSVIFVMDSDGVTMTDCEFSEIHTGAISIQGTTDVSISGTTFSSNVHAFSGSVTSVINRSNALKAQSNEVAGYAIFGNGVGITLTDISGSIELKDLTFSQNKLTYDPEKMTETELSYISRSSSIAAFVNTMSSSVTSSRSNAQADGEINPLQILPVASDIWIHSIPDSASISITGCHFNEEHMSYDEEFISTDDQKKKHFIVPDFASQAPAVVNMRHVISSRPSCCIFIAESKATISLESTEFKTIFGTAVAVIACADTSFSDVNITDLTTQTHVFSESAIYVANNVATNGEPVEQTVSISTCSFNNIKPSPLSSQWLSSDENGDSGFDLLPETARPVSNRGMARKLGGGAVSVEYVQTVQLNGLTFTDCSSNGHGGCLNMHAVTDISVSDSTFTRGKSLYGSGGAMSFSDATLSNLHLNKVTIEDCSASQRGGGVYAPLLNNKYDVYFTLINVNIKSCTSTEGGGMYLGSRSDLEFDPVPLHVFYTSMDHVNIQDCSSFYGAGMYLGALQHESFLLLNNLTISHCESSLTGAAIYISAALTEAVWYGPKTETLNNFNCENVNLRLSNAKLPNLNPIIGLKMAECHINHNKAGAIGGGVYANIFLLKPLTLQSRANSDFCPLPSNDEPVAEDFPGIHLYKTEFIENSCQGSPDSTTRFGIHGGGGFTQHIHPIDAEESPVSSRANESKIIYNTWLKNVTFESNTGGGYAPIANVKALLENCIFKDNFAKDFSTGEQFLLNIECSRSNLNISKSNNFSSPGAKDFKNKISYLCDGTCAGYSKSSNSDLKCSSPQSIEVEPAWKKTPAFDLHKYPVIDQLSYYMASFEIGTAKAIVSTSSELQLADDTIENLKQISNVNTIRARNGLASLPIHASVNKQFGNTSFSIQTVSSQHGNSRLASRLHSSNDIDPEYIGIHVLEAVATDTNKTYNQSDIPVPLKRVNVTTIGKNFTLTEDGFPEQPPKFLYAYFTADGHYWTGAIPVELLNVAPESVRKKYGFITLGILFGMILVFFIIVFSLQALTYLLERILHRSVDEVDASYTTL